MIIPSLSGITTVLTDKAPLSLPVPYKYNTNGVVTMTTIVYSIVPPFGKTHAC